MHDGTARRQARDLATENCAGDRVFVTKIDVDLGRADHVRTDQHPFQEPVRIGVEEVAVLERAGLALVGVHRHQPRPGLAPHGAPFAPGREPRAPEAA